MNNIQQEVNERTRLAGNNKFEMLLFRLGTAATSQHAELFGINVFKVRELIAMPRLTAIAGSVPHVLGVVNLRGQVIPVIDVAGLVGCRPATGLNILLVTEYARSMQAFAVEAVEDIVRLDWDQVLSTEASNPSCSMVTSIARLQESDGSTRLAQVLDVEQILQHIHPEQSIAPETVPADEAPLLPPGAVVLAADDSSVARAMLAACLDSLRVPYLMTKSGREAWDKLQELAATAKSEGVSMSSKVALVLTDLEMPEMDGFTLTMKIKQTAPYNTLPVLIHSSLSGETNEEHVRRVGADAYVAKFAPADLARTIRRVLAKQA